MSSPSPKIISVIGATGNQGGGVVEVLLESTEFHVRAISSNSSSRKAKALLDRHSRYVDERRFEIVEGNLNDRASLEKAIKGSYGVFASFAETPTEAPVEENPEVIQGKNLVDAAKAVGVQHFVYSSLPSVKALSAGRFKNVFFYETKHLVEQYARAQLKNSTFVIPGCFFSNLSSPLWAMRQDDGTFVVTTALSPHKRLGWVDDRFDVGTFVAAIFKKGPSVTAGKTYPVNSTPVTCADLAEAYTRVTGEPARTAPHSFDFLYDTLKPQVGETEARGIVEMMQFVDSTAPSPYTHGPGYIEKDDSLEDLGVKASSPEEFFRRTGWRAPPAPSDTSA
ncbi:hypothetical protein JCM16303_004995 [Sporobolomyces ruberrimus]